ncbi:MAG TPA: radical SAM family heme chaperone HemW, partial [bacterium]|nr:radical SAM family heme chaperone HemW [bacterium]
MGFSAYIHIPFCEVKCGYCDFFSVPRGFEDFDLQKEYVDTLVAEIHERSAEFSKEPVVSVFFGGGTPSLLEPKLLGRVLDALARHFSWENSTEITLETNPKTVNRDKLASFRSLGLNRISLGVQSFQDRFLKVLGRIHDGNDARRAVDDARAAGFKNVSCDLIFALPGQSFEDWTKDLNAALALGTDHLSAYHLTIESNTPFETLYKQGKLPLPAEEEGVRMLQWTRARLAEAGMGAYEISNFARPGFESVHNGHYWRYGEYLGFGAGAVSCRSSVRRHNVRSLKKYLGGDALDFEDRIDRKTAMGEFCMLGLRTREGIDAGRFEGLFGVSLQEAFAAPLACARDRGWL